MAIRRVREKVDRMNQVGSVFVVTIFVLTIMVGGLVYWILKPVVEAVDNEEVASSKWGEENNQYVDTATSVLRWVWMSLPLIVLIGLISWFLVHMQKGRYQVVGA